MIFSMTGFWFYQICQIQLLYFQNLELATVQKSLNKTVQSHKK